MNREERRKLGINKETSEKLDYLNTPCTLTEAVQISRGVAEDVLKEYHKNYSPLQISWSIQVDILKNVLIENGLITEDKFRSMYMERVSEIKDTQNQSIESDPKMDIVPNDIEVKKV